MQGRLRLACPVDAARGEGADFYSGARVSMKAAPLSSVILRGLPATVAEVLQRTSRLAAILASRSFQSGLTKMKKTLFASGGLLVLASSASAADLPQAYTKAPAVSPAINWSGFYIGAMAATAGLIVSNSARSAWPTALAPAKSTADLAVAQSVTIGRWIAGFSA